ncbi:hypothetical protein [Spongiactinospora sp. TRM90649]|uniref:hypothetical protein n=1 Tax=Spongiactinospora sp. TRM90649 TaxID=3031114 RepID=UPI0023F9409B|nr:hypothetical protein [Spongiactinospora sp. TRM90649]MDF5758631.1 hypothetical protein [Spongiactinospora sp. TRM90649]
MAMHTPDPVPVRIRYPLLVRGGIALVLMGVTRLAVAVGWIPPEWELSETGVEQAIDGVLFAWAWWTSQRHVTPVADPRDDHGRQLVAARPQPM